MDRRHFIAMLAGTLPLGAWRSAFSQALTTHSWPALRKLLTDYVVAKKLAGAAVAVADGATPLSYPKAGRIALDADAAFDEHSVCRIYSMTKSVTGLATMLLVEAGKLRLDQPVADIIPELGKLQVALDPSKGLEARPAKQTMTIRHLLTHSSRPCLLDTVAGHRCALDGLSHPGHHAGQLRREPEKARLRSAGSWPRRYGKAARRAAARGGAGHGVALLCWSRCNGSGNPARQRQTSRRLRTRTPL